MPRHIPFAAPPTDRMSAREPIPAPTRANRLLEGFVTYGICSIAALLLCLTVFVGWHPVFHPTPAKFELRAGTIGLRAAAKEIRR